MNLSKTFLSKRMGKPTFYWPVLFILNFSTSRAYVVVSGMWKYFKWKDFIGVIFCLMEFLNFSFSFNRFDCGVFMIKYADFYSRGLGLCFSQVMHMKRGRIWKKIFQWPFVNVGPWFEVLKIAYRKLDHWFVVSLVLVGTHALFPIEDGEGDPKTRSWLVKSCGGAC